LLPCRRLLCFQNRLDEDLRPPISASLESQSFVLGEPRRSLLRAPCAGEHPASSHPLDRSHTVCMLTPDLLKYIAPLWLSCSTGSPRGLVSPKRDLRYMAFYRGVGQIRVSKSKAPSAIIRSPLRPTVLPDCGGHRDPNFSRRVCKARPTVCLGGCCRMRTRVGLRLSSGFQVPRQYAYLFGSKSHAWPSKILSMSLAPCKTRTISIASAKA